ncbi:apoptosis regulator BAX-like [Talpa occidentalis]|uniref:apoptosis regulator BAX-like n=1 Tax=Talpa occidentalis TaxID=50954 RepID=UPI00188DCECF|nr:apoptosis regulator BAX-like [Talpa occidentalis]
MDGSGQQRRGGGPSSSERIMATAAILLEGFICDQIGPAAEYVPELALEQVTQHPYIKELLEVIKRIAQQVYKDKDKELQRWSETLRGFTFSGFSQVAHEIFSGGITWGKIVTLFCFASKLPQHKFLHVSLAPIDVIMDMTLLIIRKLLLPWIQEQGGWDGLLAKHGETLKWTAGGADTLKWTAGGALAIGMGLLALFGLGRT